MKTVKKHLETLPEPYKSKAFANINIEFKDKKIHSLILAFDWEKSPEGLDFWENLAYKIIERDRILDKLNTIDTRRYTSKQVVDELKRWAKEI